MSVSSSISVKNPLSEQAFVREWKQSENDGYTHLIPVTANRLRTGKTYAALRIGELLDPNFTIDNVGFETVWYIEKAESMERGGILVLDEPNRAVGNRAWFSEENRGFAEYLQTNAYRGIHGLFPLPHMHLMDNAVMGVCTSQIVMDRPGHGVVYLYERDQLNRSYNTYTPRWGELWLSKPSVKLFHAYEAKRHEYTSNRNKQFVKRLHENGEIAEQMGKKDILGLVLADIDKFMDGEGEKRRVSVKRIMGEFSVSSHKAYDVKVLAEAERIRRKISPFPSSK